LKKGLKNYKYIFFDLDRTLWDFNANSSEALVQIIKVFKLEKTVTKIDEFIHYFHLYNDQLWDDFRDGKIRKQSLREERFRMLFERYKITDKVFINSVSQYYLNTAPSKSVLIEGAKEILIYLASKYKLFVISNGFYDVQLTKVVNSGMSKYISKVFTSDRIGFAKPDKRMYEYVVKSLNAHKSDCLMVGDDVKNDILGAQYTGIDQVFFNPQEVESEIKATYEIKKLLELKDIL
jgi:putative hydrolase of the HAD superfamily